MRLVVKTDRSFFYTTLKEETGKIIWTSSRRWLDVYNVPGSDLQRKYIACILSLKKVRVLAYDSLKLQVEGKMINDQLTGKKSTGTFEVAELRSELVGLMTLMGVTIERTEIRTEKETEERR